MANPGLATLGLVILIASVAGLAVYGSPESTPAAGEPVVEKPPVTKEEAANIAASVAHETVNMESLVPEVPREGSPHSSVAADNSSVSGTVVIAMEKASATNEHEVPPSPPVPQKPSSKAFVLGLVATAVAGIVGGERNHCFCCCTRVMTCSQCCRARQVRSSYRLKWQN
jgi:hypothetical protein